MTSGIYIITNTSNGMKYVGSAINLDGRWRRHKSALRRDKHENMHLQSAYNKYGDIFFIFEVVLHCEPEELIIKEQEEINRHNWNRLYNINPVAGSQLGFKHSEETKRKLSKPKSPETRAKMRIAALKDGRKPPSRKGKRKET